MKYPQLVSTRAVNAISDWLVARLEQLGVEAPQPYTRLLLSLLQSTIQLNDPIELSNLESFLASRKGGNRRYQTCDTDALKKFNAVQCLKEIVSSEHEIATIESLIDELCEKLRVIEKQTGDSEDEHKLYVATLNLTDNSHLTSHNSNKSHNAHQAKEIHTHCSCKAGSGGGAGSEAEKRPPHIQAAATATETEASAKKNKSSIAEKRDAGDDDRQLDPLDLYRRAFPALSKEMENSFATYRRNVKWLTWPVEHNRLNHRSHALSISSSSSSTISNNSVAENNNGTCAVKSSKAKENQMLDNFTGNASKICVGQEQELFENVAVIGNDSEADMNVGATAFASSHAAVGSGSIKRKSKRRRDRDIARAKAKLIQQNAHKNYSAGTAATSGTTTAPTSMRNINSGSTASSGRNKRAAASPAYWDTDFEGCWEMGRDLIKEFITRQKRNTRNRSTSESTVSYNKKSAKVMESTTNSNNKKGSDCNEETLTLSHDEQMRQREQQTEDGYYSEVENSNRKSANKDNSLPVAVDFSFCDDDYDDTLASVSELANDGPLQKSLVNNECATADGGPEVSRTTKRLYERELIPTEMKTDEQSDFAQFEAKFNSSVEALWNDAGGSGSADAGEEKGFNSIGGFDKINVFEFGSGNGNGDNTSFSGPTSLPCDMPFKQNLKNFWTNYYSHHFDLSKMLTGKFTIGTTQVANELIMQSKTDDIGTVGCSHSKINLGVRSGTADKINLFSAADSKHLDSSIFAATTSDYYSMPNTLENMTKDKVQLQCRGQYNNSGCSDSEEGSGGGNLEDERKTPVALFLQSSIWSESAGGSAGGDTDESFFFKVHNSGRRRLNQYEGGVASANENYKNCGKISLQATDDVINDVKSSGCTSLAGVGSGGAGACGRGFVFTTPYTGSKWSEGINAEPPANVLSLATVPQQTQQQQQQQSQQMPNNKRNNHVTLNCLSGTDCIDSSSSINSNATRTANACVKNSLELIQGGSTREGGLQNIWSNSNATAQRMRETSNVATQKQQQQQQHLSSFLNRSSERDLNKVVATPEITLMNHSPATSGFIAYSRIKSVMQLRIANDDENMTLADNHQHQQYSEPHCNYTQRNNSKELTQQQHRYALDMLEEGGENLLTSERTHFHPIKSYADGHTFDICSDLDIIEYRRSASGYLYYDQEKYLEYTRMDNFMVEDDGTGNGGFGASVNPLYANSNCDAAAAGSYNNHPHHQSNSKTVKRVDRDFVIKFRLQRTEIACQTDVVPPKPAAAARALVGGNNSNRRDGIVGANIATTAARPHPLSLIFSNAAKNLKAVAANQLIYSDTVEAFNRAMAHFPPPTAAATTTTTPGSNSIWLPTQCGAVIAAEEESLTTAALPIRGIWNMYQQQSKNGNKHAKNSMKDLEANYEDYGDDTTGSGYDELDFYGCAAAAADVTGTMNTANMDTDVDMTSLEQEWSMNEILRKCKEAGHMAVKNTNNKSVGSAAAAAASSTNDGDDNTVGAIESVWGMCAACNSELKSIPANRLLRDELQMEGDEIMSDLKYMQDLYIGRRAGDQRNAEEDDGDDDGDGDDDDDDDADGNGNDDCVDDISGADTVTSGSDWYAEDGCGELQPLSNDSSNNTNEPPATTEVPEFNSSKAADTVVGNNAAINDADTLTVIQKVNRLIVELLRPENNNNNNNRDDFYMEKLHSNASANANSECTVSEARSETIGMAGLTATEAPLTPFGGNLRYSSNAERNIWQLNEADSNRGGGGGGDGALEPIDPIQLLRQFNVQPNEGMAANIDNILHLPGGTASCADAECRTTQLNWEHANLARIWQTSPQEPHIQAGRKKQEIMQVADSSELAISVREQMGDDENSDIAQKNMRNLRANADASVEAAAANLQKAKEFLVRHSQKKLSAGCGGLTGDYLPETALKSKTITRKRRHSASQNYFHTPLICASAAKTNTTVVLHNNNNSKISDLNSYGFQRSAASALSATATAVAINNNELNFRNLLNAASLHFGAAAAAAVAAASNGNANAKKCADYATAQRHLCGRVGVDCDDGVDGSGGGGMNMSYCCDATAAAAKNQTIITCKYHLTTIDPIMAMNNTINNNNGGGGGGVGGGCGGSNGDDIGAINDIGLFDGVTSAAPLSCIIDKNPSILNHVTMMARPLTR